MPSLLWSGKLTPLMTVLVNANNLLSLLNGNLKDVEGMKKRVRQGYEGKFSQHVHRYDQLGYLLQDRSARIQLGELSFEGMHILDVGCGTGALACVALEKRAAGVVCGDIAAFMLKGGVKKLPVPAESSHFASWMRKPCPTAITHSMRSFLE